MTEAAFHIRFASRIRLRLTQVSGATMALTLIGLMTRAVTVITQILIARQFGTTIYSDAFFATEVIPDVFVNLVAGGLAMVFIPLYAEYRVHQGDGEAWRFASAFLIGSSLLSVAFAGAILVAAPLLVSVIAPGFDGEARAVAIRLMRIMAISITLLGLNAGLRGLLQSHRDFLMPDLARFVHTCVLCATAWVFSARFGVYSLGWGIVIGVGLQFVLQLRSATRQRLLHAGWSFDHPGTRRAARQLVPLVIAISWTSVIFVQDRMAASGMAEGSIAAINYANRMIMLPVGIFAIPLQTTLYPTLSNLAAENKLKALAGTTLKGIRVLLFIIMPACVGLAVLSVPLIRLLFQHGAFDADATRTTSQALTLYAIGVPMIGVILFMNSVYFSLGKLSVLVRLNLVSWTANMALNVILGRAFGHQGIALATSITAFLTVILLLYFVIRDPLHSFDTGLLLRSSTKILAISLAMGFLLVWLWSPVHQFLGRLSLDYQVIELSVLIAIGLGAYLLAAYLIRLDELRIMTRAMRKLVK